MLSSGLHKHTKPIGDEGVKALAIQVRGQEFGSPECTVDIGAYLWSKLVKQRQVIPQTQPGHEY